MKPRIEFWSSTQLGAFQPPLLATLESAGWRASQFYEISQSVYHGSKSRAARWRMRLRSYGLYPLKLGWRFGRGRTEADLVGVVSTNTFYAPWLALHASARRVPVVHWVLDLYPDVMVAAGRVRPGGGIERVLRHLLRDTFDRAAANVFLGEGLRRWAEVKFGPIPRSHVIPVGADGGPFRESPPQSRIGRAVKMLYCGNLGRMHDIETIRSALGDGLPAGLEVEFRGNGAGFQALRAQFEGGRTDQVRFGDNVPDSEWIELMKSADIALVTVARGAEGIIMPSKAYSALVAGQAILAICPRASDLASLVRNLDCGWVVEPNDTAGLASLLRQIAADPSALMERRRRAFASGHSQFDSRVVGRQWQALFAALSSKSGLPDGEDV